MNKILYVLIFVALSTCTFAQVTITSSNYYQPGRTVRDVYAVENDANDSVSNGSILVTPLIFGNSLEAQFDVYNLTDTVVYAGPSTEGEFTDETCSFADENGMRMHLNVTDEKAVCLGISGALTQLGLNDNMEIEFDEPMEVISFPAVINSTKNSTAHGSYKDHVSELQSAINAMGGYYGSMIYSALVESYDSVMMDIQVTYNSSFDETGSLTLSGSRMMQGEYEYLRENRQYSYITNMYLRNITSGQYQNINDCVVFGMNVGEVLQEYAGMQFPITSTTTTLNYWISNDNYPIVEMTTNADLTYTKHIAIRYEDHTTFCSDLEFANIEIFPNPTTDILNIAVEDMDNGIMNIYSTNGSLVKEVKLNGSLNSINVNDLHNGCYFFNILYGDKEISGKFAKN